MRKRKATRDTNSKIDILVTGNGLDLHCGLKSSFKDFFDSKLRISSSTFNENEIASNIWYLIFTFSFMLESNEGGTPIIPFIDNNNPLWMDVETLIKKSLMPENGRQRIYVYDLIKKELTYKGKNCIFSNPPTISGNVDNQYVFLYFCIDKIKSKYKTVEELFIDELKRFEKDFANYLKEEVQKNKEIYMKNLDNFISSNFPNYKENGLFVLTFNYTDNFPNYIKSENIVHIHGTLDKDIIIGVGKITNDKFDKFSIFEKTKRRVIDDLGPLNLPSIENVKTVNFYGCSMNKQDFEYYFSIFKKYKLEEGNMKFNFLYSDFYNNDVDNRNNKQKYKTNCLNVIDKYLKQINQSVTSSYLYDNGCIEFKCVN